MLRNVNKGKEKSETQKRKNGTKKEERVRSTSLTRREREENEVVEVTSTWSGLCGVRTNNFEGKERKGKGGIATGAKVERVKNFNAIQRQRRHAVEEKRERKRSEAMTMDELSPRGPISRLHDSTSSLLYSVVSYDDPSYFFLSPYPSPSLRHPTSRSPPSLFLHPKRSGRLQRVRFEVKELQRFFGGVDRERLLLLRRGSIATRVEDEGYDHEELKLQSLKERSQGKERRIVRTLRRVERRTCREGCNDSVELR